MEKFFGQFSGYLPHSTEGYISLVAAVLGIISLLWIFPFRFIFTVFIMTVGVWAGITFLILYAIPPLPTKWAMIVSTVITGWVYGLYIPYGFVNIEPQKAGVYRNKYSLTGNGYIALREGVRTTMFIYEHYIDVDMGLRDPVEVSGPAKEQQLIYNTKNGEPYTATLTVLWKVGDRSVDIIRFAKNNNDSSIVTAIRNSGQVEIAKLIIGLEAKADSSGRMQIDGTQKDFVRRTLATSMKSGSVAKELERFGIVIVDVQLSDIDPPKIVEEEREEASGEASAIRAKLQTLKDFGVEITESIARGVVLSETEGDGHHGGGNIVVDNIGPSGDGQHQHKKGKGRRKKNRQGGGNTP